MKRSHNNMLGVTLLEIMLVMAIAAMVIVMSIRYYATASASEQANILVEQIQSVISAVDGVTQGSGSYSGVNNSSIVALMPNTGLSTSWGGTITVTGTGATTYTIAMTSVPKQICPLVVAKLFADNHLGSVMQTCSSSAATALTYTYTSVI